MSDISEELEMRYNVLFTKYRLEQPLAAENIGAVIRESLRSFLKNAKIPAIYCNGGHTKMLMDAYIYELKKVRYIVDNYAVSDQEKGFALIKDSEIESCEIDAIVLSTYKFRKDLKESLQENHPDIPVLDIYDELERAGILMQSDYYYSNHPYQHYKRINQLQRDIKETSDNLAIQELYRELVTEYLHIKDFRTAAVKLNEWMNLKAIAKEDKKTAEQILEDVEDIYALEKEAAGALSENHVLMLCLDGLRRQDLSEETMPKLQKLMNETGYQFTNAYSFSTSTYESLIPVYSENGDFRTRYYEKNYVDIKDCRFAALAEKQKKAIYIYGDGEPFIRGDNIHYSEQFLTVTEKLWQFIIDGCNSENGLFYLHELYESHFTFSNPYTETTLMSEGTAMLFDFLPAKGGRLRADYAKQHDDAIRYLDDVTEPLLRPVKCRMLVYADHGNLILDYNTKISEVRDMEYTCSEGWTRIPLILRSPEMGAGTDDSLLSLMELNKMVISLLRQEVYQTPDAAHIKIARSELYNPDFRYLYEMAGKKQSLQAFECFLFTNKRKLIIFADGTAKVYDAEDREAINNVKNALVDRVYDEITVCDISRIQR